VPVAEPLGQTAPFATLLGDVHDGVEHVQIVERHGRKRWEEALGSLLDLAPCNETVQ
jgi:hypothetical protein